MSSIGDSRMMNDLPVISVVVATSYRYKLLEMMLESLKNQTFQKFEAILICIKKNEQLKKIAKMNNAQLLEDEGKGRSYARNIGINESKGKIIAFFDDDVVLGKNWLDLIVKDFRANPNAGGIGGIPVSVNYKGIPISHIRGRILVTIYNLLMSKSLGLSGWTIRPKYKAKVNFLSGSNMAFLVSALKKIDGFDEKYYGTSTAEDIDLCLRVQGEGYFLILEPKAKVYHYVRSWLRGHKNDPAFFLDMSDNQTYCRVKNQVLKGPFKWFSYLLYQFFQAFGSSIVTANPRIFFSYVKGILIGYTRARRVK